MIRSWRERVTRLLIGVAAGALFVAGAKDHSLWWWGAGILVIGFFTADER